MCLEPSPYLFTGLLFAGATVFLCGVGIGLLSRPSS